jgi:hypothetical protein
MKYLILTALLLTGCSNFGAPSGMSLHLQEYPQFNWIDQDIFMLNVRTCRSLDHCAAEQLFN